MTSKNFSVALMLLGMAGASCVAQVQSKTKPTFKVAIPFQFTVGNRALPAGVYSIQALLDSRPGPDAIEILALRGDGHVYQTTVTDSVSGVVSASDSRLVFDRYGDRSFLSEVSDWKRRLVLHVSPQEKELAKNQPKVEVVIRQMEDNREELANSSAMQAK